MLSHSDGQALMVIFYACNKAMLMSPAESLRFTEDFNRDGTEYWEQMLRWGTANRLRSIGPCVVDSRFALDSDARVELTRQIRADSSPGLLMQSQTNIIRNRKDNSVYPKMLPEAFDAVDNWTESIYRLTALNVRLDVPNVHDRELELSENMSLEGDTQSLTEVDSET